MCPELERIESLDVSTTIVDFQNVTSADLCEDLERLLETGYAELIQSKDCDSEEEDEEEEEGYEVAESQHPKDLDLKQESQSPFPRGLAIYDYDESEDEEQKSPSSGKEGNQLAESEYEVICARDISSVPIAPTQGSVLGAGANFVMGKASKLIGSFFRH